MNDQPNLPIRGRKYDHPEHYRDKISSYSSKIRDIPKQLQDLLLEQSGHRCSVCKEPYCDIHHIKPLKDGGKTEYENLIVLCPNCHRRVHIEKTIEEKHLKHYKLKQEVSYGLPIIGRLTLEEKNFLKKLSAEPEEELVLFDERHHGEITAEYEEARKIFRKTLGLLYLESEGIIKTEYEDCILLSGCDEGKVFVSLLLRVTDKGMRWLRYLKKTNYLDLME